MRSRRAAGVGYGKKYDFSKVVASNPGPSQYKNPSVFDRNKRKNIGKTFGVSRERMAATGAMVINMNQPGPGQYKLKRRFKNLRYSMRAKTLNPYSYTTAKEVPGPGQYKMISGVSPDGKQYWSKYKSSRCRKISNSKISRSLPVNLSVPGPGVYSAKTQLINGKGSYFPSNLKSNLGRSFGNQIRPSINDLAARQNFPGPGQYVAPSDFPHVTFKNANAGHMQSKMSQSFLNGDGTGADAGAGGDGGNDAKAPHEKTRDSVS